MYGRLVAGCFVWLYVAIWFVGFGGLLSLVYCGCFVWVCLGWFGVVWLCLLFVRGSC